MYKVIKKYKPPPGQAVPGEHYTVENPAEKNWWFRTIHFYRSPNGRENAMDGIRHSLMQDGDLYRAVKAAVDAYDKEHGQ